MENYTIPTITQKVTLRNKKTNKIRDNLKFNKDFFEKLQWEKNNLICGIDEVGRGCLAGPVVVAAVILKPFCKLKLLKDSKVLTKDELLSTSNRIIKDSWFAFGIVNNIDIDNFNIYQSTLIAMKKAVINLFSVIPRLPSLILIDAMPLTLTNTFYNNIDIKYFPKGESISRSIAAASIIAKVKRDSLMNTYDKHLPNYQFSQHKGYATLEHQSFLKVNGKSILHRESFLNNFNHLLNENREEQNSIF